jgi:putative Ca2+/H+ antiporter (TMEM165/GDT1 family)
MLLPGFPGGKVGRRRVKNKKLALVAGFLFLALARTAFRRSQES